MTQKEAFWHNYRHPETGEEAKTTVFQKETKKQKDGRKAVEAALEAAGFVKLSTVDLLDINKDVK